MALRWISAAIGIPVFLGLALWSNPVPFCVAVLILATISLGEMIRAYRGAGIRVNPVLAVGGLIAPAAVVWIAIEAQMLENAGWVYAVNRAARDYWLLALAAALTAAALFELIGSARSGEICVGQALAFGLLCAIYISLFAGLSCLQSVVRFRSLSVTPQVVLSTVFSVWATDSFALFVGKAFGKRKLAPKLSPGKTVEGAIGGLFFGMLTGAVFGWLFFRNVALGLTIGVIAGVFGQVGDLFESALKREIGIKDFGGIIPGHGGVLDRFDSLLFVAPLACLVFNYWRW